MGKRIKRNKIVSLVLTAFMIVSVFAVSIPQQAEAAGSLNLSFKNGKGKSTVTISDRECTEATNKIAYITFKPKVTGYITVKMTNSSSVVNAVGYITLCNNKKQPIGHNNEPYMTVDPDSWSYTRTYGIRKGKTYYFAVQSTGGVKLTANIKATSKSNANSRKKAKNLNSGKKANGVIIAGENKVDWYKINVKKQKPISIRLSVKTSGASGTLSGFNGNIDGIRYTFCDKNGKPWNKGNYDDYARMTQPTVSYLYQMRNPYTGATFGIEKGVYYIKVERHTKVSSGQYTLSWKYK